MNTLIFDAVLKRSRDVGMLCENKRDSTIFAFALHVKSSLGVFVKFIAVVDLLVLKTEGIQKKIAGIVKSGLMGCFRCLRPSDLGGDC